MSEEIPNQLRESYKVPNEEEIIAELDIQDKIHNLADELEEKQKQLDYYKERMLEKKIKEIEDKKAQLRGRLDEIDQMPDWDTTGSKMKAIEIKKKANQWEEKEREKQEELIALRKEHELEKIVRKKMELEKLLEEKKALTSNYRQVNTQLNVIREEKEKRDLDSVKLLDRALERGHLLKDQIKKGALTEKDKALLADTYFEDTLKAKQDQERLLYEVQAFRFQDAQKANIDTKEKIKNLNDIRFALREKEEKLLKQKALHHEMMKRGVDYLADIELGNAPPIEFLEKNIRYDPEDYRNDKPLTEVLKYGEGYMHDAQEKIEYLEKDRERLRAYLDKHGVYNGELKPWLAQQNPGSLEAARYILEIVFEGVFGQIDHIEKLMAAQRKEAETWEDKAKKIDKKRNFFLFAASVKGVGLDLLDRVIDKMVREIALETHKINEDARKMAGIIIFRALRLERNFQRGDAEIENHFFELRGGERKKKEKYKFQFKDRDEINDKDVQALSNKPKKKIEDENDNREYAINELDPEKSCVENLGSFDIRKLELGYFEKIQLQDNDIIDIFARIRGGIATMAISPNGHLLGVATTNGIIGVVNLKLETPQLVFVYEESNFLPHKLVFSHDSSSQLVGLDSNGFVKTYLLYGNPSAKMNPINWLPQKDIDLRPPELSEFYTLDWKYISRPKNRTANDREFLTITECGFFSSYTLLGFQTSIIVGTKAGVVMKFNGNKRLGGVYMQNSIFRTTNLKPLPKSDPDQNKEIDALRAKAGPKGSQPHLYREFFIGHQSEIIFITTLERPQNILTVDKDGRIFIWEYSEAYLGDDQCFRPKQKFKVKLEVTTYQPVGEKIQIFPPKETKEKNNPANIQKQGETKFRDYDKSADFKSRVLNAKKTTDLGLTEVTVCKSRFPTEGQIEPFQFITFNYDEKRIVLEQEQGHKAISTKGFVGNIQGSANNRFIFLQLILPHKLKAESNNIVFIAFNTLTSSLKKLKVTLEVPRLDSGVDFLVSDNYTPHGASYIYMLLRDGIYVISTATGLIVKIFKDHLQKIDPSLKNKFEFDQFQVFKNKDIYLASTGNGMIWRFKLKDGNTREDYHTISKEKPEFLKLLNL